MVNPPQTFLEYQLMVKRLMKGDDICWALGLAGESGEVVELIKKLHYHNGADKKRTNHRATNP